MSLSMLRFIVLRQAQKRSEKVALSKEPLLHVTLLRMILRSLWTKVNKISHKAFGEEKDLIGRVYEYFLKEFAVNATKEEGEFYTPHDVVQLIATMIEPYDGTLYDPCCGSGGMFIQSAELVKNQNRVISIELIFMDRKRTRRPIVLQK